MRVIKGCGVQWLGHGIPGGRSRSVGEDAAVTGGVLLQEYRGTASSTRTRTGAGADCNGMAVVRKIVGLGKGFFDRGALCMPKGGVAEAVPRISRS